MSIGLALSGGGSRAAAFHRGVVHGLNDTGILPAIEIVSTVSGGSLFGAAWMASLAQHESLDSFLSRMGRELEAGFVRRSFRPRALKMILPGRSRTDVLADTFDNCLLHGLKLRDLPDNPRLCINVVLMNNGQLGKFSKGTFRCKGLVPASAQNEYSRSIDMPDFSLARAATASAAFPGLLPPVILRRGEGGIPEQWGSSPELRGQERLALADGGILDNLGVQSLLSGMSGFSAWDLIVSDAGAPENLWKPKSLFGKLVSQVASTALAPFLLAPGALSMSDLYRVALIMNSKEIRQMRHQIFETQTKSWLESEMALGKSTEPLKQMVEYEMRQAPTPPRRRRVLFCRIEQTWRDLVRGLPVWRRFELAEKANHKGNIPGQSAQLEEVESFIESCLLDLSTGRDIYIRLGGEVAVEKLIKVKTRFYGLPASVLDGLSLHGQWQMHALKTLYWD